VYGYTSFGGWKCSEVGGWTSSKGKEADVISSSVSLPRTSTSMTLIYYTILT
jgi:hypothetical protein